MCGFFIFKNGSGMVENYKKAEIDYMAGMKYKDLAEKYGTTINTIKSWKKRYGWERKKGAHKNEKGCTQNKQRAAVAPVQPNDGTKETLENDELTPEQQMFCVFYSKTFNATQSYLKAYGCKYETAMVEGSRTLRNPKIKKEIERLKEIKRQQIVAGAEDIVELQMRIAFGDIGDVLKFGKRGVDLKDSDMIDTQLIASVKEGKDGVSVKMKDSQKAIDWLTKYFELNPMDQHKREFDKRRLELEILRLEMQTKDTEDSTAETDNFLDALNQTAQEVWQHE